MEASAKIDGLKIAKTLKTAGIDQDKADDLAQELADAYDNAEKDMASLEDLNVISARSDARIEAANTRIEASYARIEAAIIRQTIWIAAIAFIMVGAIAAIVKL